MSFFENLVGGLASGLGSSVIGTGMNIVGGLVSNNLQQKNARYWANYNSPIQQMKRLKEAGLNPALAYGNGSVANTYDANTSVQSISGGEQNTRYLSPQEYDLLIKQEEIYDADKKLKLSQKKQVDEATYGLMLDNKRKFSADPIAMGEVDKKLRDAELESKNISNKINKELARIGVDKEYFLNNTFNQYAYDLTRNLIQEVQYQYADAKARLENGLLSSQEKLNYKTIEKINAEIPYLTAQVNVAYALADNYKSATNLNDKKAFGESLKNLMLYFDSYFGKYGLNKGLAGDVLRPIMRMIDNIKSSVGVKNGDWQHWNYFEEFNNAAKNAK